MKIKALLLLPVPLLLAACGLGAKSPASVPTIILGNPDATAAATPAASHPAASGGVTASGFVVAAQTAQLAFLTGGNVKTVSVAAGDAVQAGQSLVQLDDTVQQIALIQAQQNLLELTSPAAIAAAQQTAAQDQQDVFNAQAALNNLIYAHENQDSIQNAQASLVLAQNDLSHAQQAYNNVAGNPDADPRKAAAYQDLYAAQLIYNKAAATYNLMTGKVNQAQVDKAKATLALAQAKLSQDQALVAILTGGTAPDHPTGPGYVALQQARLAVQTAQHNLDGTRLAAPFPGTVVTVTAVAGEYVAPGEILIGINNTALQVETTDLSEVDVPKVAVGQPATVTVKALSQDIPGKVSAISSQASTLGGDVVYQVTVQLDQLPAGLLAGMSVVVNINP